MEDGSTIVSMVYSRDMASSNTSITTSDGEVLEAEFFLPANPVTAVVITHPNPLMGGDMHTPVPGAFFRALDDLHAAGLRFNFRGVGKSTGTHDKGQAEQLDLAAAIEHLAAAVPDMPLLLAGWSFGADVALTTADDRVAGWYLAAPPLRVVDPSIMEAKHAGAPKVLAVGENDQFAPPQLVADITDGWTATEIRVIAGADHFFGAQMTELIDGFKAFVASTS